MLWKEGSSVKNSLDLRVFFFGGGGVAAEKYERNLTLLVESEAFILFSVPLIV